MLPDGRYDAFVVWAERHEGEGEGEGRLRVELTITSGPHKGEVVTLTASVRRDPLALVGLPCTLVVEDGRPRLEELED